MPIRFETTFLLRTCYRPLKQLGTVCDRLCYRKCIQERFTANAKHQDGLLRGLTRPPGRTGLTGFQRPFFGTGAAAPGK